MFYKSGRRAGARDLLDLLLILVALAALVVGMAINVRYGGGTLFRIGTPSMNVHADFDSFWRSARAVWMGGSVYSTGARLVNLNPPFWTVIFAPFGLLGELDAYRTFVLLSLFITIGYLAWTASELRMHAGWATLATGALFLSSPLLATLALGQIYPVLTLGLVASWISDRWGKEVISGVLLGLVVAVKPSLLPVLLWPLVRRKWGSLGSAVIAGIAATLVGTVVLGANTTLDWIKVVRTQPLSTYWDNASLPSAAARMFTHNQFARPIAELPWMVAVAYIVGVVVVLFTAIRIWRGSEGGLWALVAASLLVSPVAWNNYLMMLAPGIFLLIARGRTIPAILLLALQFMPPQWPILWSGKNSIPATLAMTFYLYSLVAHWASFVTFGRAPGSTPRRTTRTAARKSA